MQSETDEFSKHRKSVDDNLMENKLKKGEGFGGNAAKLYGRDLNQKVRIWH